MQQLFSSSDDLAYLFSDTIDALFEYDTTRSGRVYENIVNISHATRSFFTINSIVNHRTDSFFNAKCCVKHSSSRDFFLKTTPIVHENDGVVLPARRVFIDHFED